MKSKNLVAGLVSLLAILIWGGITAPAARSEEGVLTIAFDAGDTPGWDIWRQAILTPDKFVCSFLYSGLVRFKPGDMDPTKFEPDLAEKWEKSADGLTWTFHLRKGVQWHRDFGELTSEDVVYSLTNARDNSWMRMDFVSFKEIKALDKYTVQIVLSQPIPSLLGTVADYHGGWIQCKAAREKLGKDYGLNPVGTGPYQFQEYIPKQRAVFVANEKYFRGKPKLKKVVVRYMPDLASREMAFRKGEVNVIEGVREQQWVEKMKDVPDSKVEIFGPGEILFVHFNTAKKPFDDIRLRKAFCFAVDKKALINFIGKDVTVPAVSPVPSDYLGATEKVERYEYDPAMAKKLLAEAGYAGGGPSFEDVVTEQAAYRRPMEAIQAQLKSVGIDLKLRVIEHPAFHKLIRQGSNAATPFNCARFPIADYMLTQFFHSKSMIGKPTAAFNFSMYDKVDSLLDEARVETNPGKQVGLWEKTQQQIMSDAVVMPLYVLKFVFARSTAVDLGYDLKSTLFLGPPVYWNTSVSR
jgi:peptide/nickel transport system substrate-binding protein